MESIARIATELSQQAPAVISDFVGRAMSAVTPVVEQTASWVAQHAEHAPAIAMAGIGIASAGALFDVAKTWLLGYDKVDAAILKEALQAEKQLDPSLRTSPTLAEIVKTKGKEEAIDALRTIEYSYLLSTDPKIREKQLMALGDFNDDRKLKGILHGLATAPLGAAAFATMAATGNPWFLAAGAGLSIANVVMAKNKLAKKHLTPKVSYSRRLLECFRKAGRSTAMSVSSFLSASANTASRVAKDVKDTATLAGSAVALSALDVAVAGSKLAGQIANPINVVRGAGYVAKGTGQGLAAAGEKMMKFADEWQDNMSRKFSQLRDGVKSSINTAKAVANDILSTPKKVGEHVNNAISKFASLLSFKSSHGGEAVSSREEKLMREVDELKQQVAELTKLMEQRNAPAAATSADHEAGAAVPVGLDSPSM